MIPRLRRGALAALALAGCGQKAFIETTAVHQNDSASVATSPDPTDAAIVAHFFNTASIAQDQAATLVAANAQTQLALDGGANAAE